MSKYGQGNFTLFLVDAYNLVASIAESAAMSKESITQQTNAFGASSEAHSPINITKGALNVAGGFYDQTTDALHGAIGPNTGVQRIISVGIEGNVIGKHFTGFEGPFSLKYQVQDTRDAITKATVDYLVSGDVDEGVIVQNLAAITADQTPPTGDTPVDNTLDVANRSIAITGNTLANPTVVTSLKAHGLTTGDRVFFTGSNSTPSINGLQTVTVISATTFSVPVNVTIAGTAGFFVDASTNAGGVGYMHVTAFSGFTGYIGKIMHSPDDTTYAALVTFTNKTAIGKERIVVAGNVDRYLSAFHDVTGAGSVTVFMGFARY